MSLTEEQKAFHLRKMRTRAAQFDVNKDGYMSKADFDKIADNLIKYGKIPSDQTGPIYSAFNGIVHSIGLTSGEKKTLEETAKLANDNFPKKTPEERQETLNNIHGSLFNVIDLNGDGHISPEEFQVYYKIFENNLSDADVTRSFNAIDTDKNGEISRAEFIAAVDDFIYGVEETEVSKTFCGPLI